MEFHEAIRKWNMEHPRNRESFERIAQSLRNIKTGKPLTKQALHQISNRGGQKGFIAYKEQLKEILPDELFAMIDFPQRIRLKRNGGPNIPELTKDALLNDDEKARLSNVPYIVVAELYRKCIDGVPLTRYMKDKVMKKVEIEEERLRNINATM